MKKRLLSVILAVSMLTSLSQTVLAETVNIVTDAIAENAALEEAFSGNPDDDDISFDPDYAEWKENEARKLSGENSDIQLMAADWIQNDYLELTTSGSSFRYYTTEGDPDVDTDNYVRLLYNNTSGMYVNVDDYVYRYNGYSEDTENENQTYSSTWFEDICVEQIFSFVHNPYTDRDDTVEFKYVFTNDGDTTRRVGGRLFFDIMLDSNDRAPFKIPGYGDVTTETEFTKENMPQVWQSFDDLNNPTVIASGTLYNNINDMPDRIQFLNYGNGTSEIWDCSLTPGRSLGDTAVNFYFDPIELAPGESRTVKTYYGISQFGGVGEMLSAFAPQELEANETKDAYLGNPFTFNGFVENKTSEMLTNVTATIELPEEMSVEGETVINLGNIEPGANMDIAWEIKVSPQYKDAVLPYAVTIGADEIEELEINNFTIRVPRLIDDFGNSLGEKDGILTTEEETKAKFEIDEDVDYFKFVPSETGTYSFESLSDASVYGVLMNPDDADVFVEDRGSGINNNFYFVEELEKDKEYYLYVTSGDAGYDRPEETHTLLFDVAEDEIVMPEFPSVTHGPSIEPDPTVEPEEPTVEPTATPRPRPTATSEPSPEPTEEPEEEPEESGNVIKYSIVVTKLEDDAGNKYESAATLAEDTEIKGTINYPCDIDVYSIDATKDGWYIISSNADTGQYTELRNEYGDLLSEKYNYGLSEIKYELKAGSKYYIIIKNLGYSDKDDAVLNDYSLLCEYDRENPVITSISGDKEGLINNSMGIRVNTQDNIGVREVTLMYSYDKEAWNTISTTEPSSRGTAYFTFDSTDLEDGNIYISAVASDYNGNTSLENTVKSYVIDNTAPDNVVIQSACSTVGANFISWTKPVAEDTKGYNLYRSSNDGKSFEKLADISDIETLYYIDTAVTTGLSYIYKVCAYDTLQENSGTVSEPVLTNNDSQFGTGVKNLTVVPSDTELFVGETSSLTATIEYVNGKKKNVTGSLSYALNDNSVISVDSNGNVKAIGAGTAMLSVIVGEIQIQIPYNVKSLEVLVSSATIVGNGTSQFTVKNYTLDGVVDVTSQATYVPDNTEVVSVGADGKIQALTTGRVNITVSYAGQSEIVTIYVYAPPGKVTEINVPDKEIDVPVNQVFTWKPSSETESYNIYIWKKSVTRPSRPVSSKLSATMYKSRLEYNTEYYWQIESVNQYAKTISDTFEFKTIGLPDLQCTSVAAPADVFSESQLEVEWEVKNTGTVSTGSKQWYDYVYLSPSVVFDSNTAIYMGRKSNYTYLATNESYINKASFTVPRGTVGKYYVFVFADRSYNIQELDDSNNSGKSDAIDVKLCPQPDLKLVSVEAAPENIISGNRITVKWNVENIGDEIPESPYIGGWIDNIYISKDETLSSDDTQLAAVPITVLRNNSDVNSNTHIFYTNKKYTALKDVTVPQNIFGDYYIIVNTDNSNVVYENDAFNNDADFKIKVTLDPPADITAEGVTVPEEMVSAGKYTISWFDINEGVRDISNSSWSDRIYISKDKKLDTSKATLLKTVNGIRADELNSTEIIIPSNYEGDYYIHIVSDYAHRIFEYETYDNNISSQKVSVEFRALPDLTVRSISYPETVRANDKISVRYTVANIGNGNTVENSWRDSVYISQSEIFDSSAQQITYVQHNGNVTAGGEYTNEISVIIPSDVTGEYYLYVRTDSRDTVQETGSDTNNAEKSGVINILERLAADLQVSSATSTGVDSNAGALLPINFTVVNNGEGTAAGTWYDYIYLSTSQENPYENGIRLASIRHSGELAQNESYSVAQNVILSGSLNGVYYVHVIADGNNAVYEKDSNNNNTKLIDMISVDGEPGTGGDTDVPDSIEIIFDKPSNLNVVSVDAPKSVEAGAKIKVSWKIENISENKTNNSSWVDAIYLVPENEPDYMKGEKLGTVSHAGELKKDDSYEASGEFDVPYSLSGNYKVVVVADANGRIIESQRENNFLSAAELINVEAAKTVDFAVKFDEVSNELTTGQPITLSWEVTNVGEAEANGRWYDTIYLSYTETTLDMKLTEVRNPKNLAVNETYKQTATVNLPVTVKGPMYLVVKSNNASSNGIYEVNFDNNTEIKPVSLTEMSAVDLTVGNINIPEVAYPGNEITVSWDVVNLSTQSLNATMTDNVYVSADEFWDINDVPVGELTRRVSLAGNSKTYESLTVAMPDYETLSKVQSVLTDDMPGVQQGEYYIIVRTDVKNQVNENNKTNNRVASSRTLDASVAKIELGETESGRIHNHNEKFYRFSTDGGESINVDLSCVDTEAINELYVSYNKVPTSTDYDFKFTEAMTSDHTVRVPVSQKGEYYVYVKNISAAAAGTEYDVNVNAVDYGVEEIYPKSGARGKVTIKLSGALLESNMKATLNKGRVKINAEEIYYFDSSTAYATFDLSYASYGVYSLTVSCNGNAVTLSDCFTLENTPVGELNVVMNAPSSYQLNSVGSASLRYKNVGNTDIPAPIFVVSADGVMFKKADAAEFSYDPMVVYGYNSEGPAGILPPGAESVYNFAFKGTTTGAVQYNIFTYDQIEDLQMEEIVLTEESTYDDRMSYAINQELGKTGKSYTEALSKIASYYSQFGYVTNDPENLLMLLYQNVMGANTNTELSAMEDVRIETGENDISFLRSYMSGSQQRKTKSLFGYGWSSIFDGDAIVDGDMIVVSYPSGMRFFEADGSGSYKEAGNDAKAEISGSGITVTEKNGMVTTYGSNGKILSTVDAAGNEISLSYDGNKLTGIHYPNATLTLSYNGNYVSSMASSDGKNVTYTYDGDFLTSVTTENGTVSYEYDTSSVNLARNALTRINYIDGSSQRFMYDEYGRLQKDQINSGINANMYRYGVGGEVSVTNALGKESKMNFNHNGQLVRTINPDGVTTEINISEDGMNAEMVYSLYSKSNYTYNENGDVIKYTNALGHSISTEYDELGNVSAVTDERGNTTYYSYDGAKLSGITYSDGTSEKYEYNSDNKISVYTDRNGNTITYSYDEKGNTIGKSYSDGTSASFAYDDRNNVISVTDVTGTTTFEYDSKNQVTKVTYGDGKSISYEYDSFGRRKKITDADNISTNYSYDSSGRLAELRDDSGNSLVKYTYDRMSRVTKKVNGNGTYTTYVYTATGNIKNLVNFDSDGRVNSQFAYTYDRFGNISQIDTKEGTYYYEYDLLKQLVSATEPNGKVTRYTYDATGNRVSEQTEDGTVYYSVNELNQYTQIGNVSYSYDAAGNMITKTDETGTTTYSYDIEGNLVNVTSPLGIWEYSYNAMGKRVKESENGNVTNYLHDLFGNGGVIAEYGTGEVTRYIYGINLEMLKNSTGSFYYDFNAQGSTIGITNLQGEYVNKYNYSPFGEVISKTENIYNSFNFAGKFNAMRTDVGLYCIGERYYDASIGRFVSTDNYGHNVRTNGYIYCYNNPQSYVDVGGEFPIAIVAGVLIAGVIGGAVNAYGSYKEGNSITSSEFWIDTGIGAGSGVAGALTALIPGAGAYAAPFVSAGINSFGTSLYDYNKQGKSIDSDFWLKGATQMAADGIIGLLGGELAKKFIPLSFSQMGNLARLKYFGSMIKSKAFWKQLGQTLTGTTLEQILGLLKKGWGFVMDIFGSLDPNDMIGPASYGDANWVSKSAKLDYMIRCENDPVFATAPVQYLTITQELDDSLDLRTFRLGSFGFGGQVFEVPANKALYQTRLDLTKEMGLYVDVWAGIDIVSGVATWTFTAVDPETGEKPVDPLVGFLPVNNREIGDGEGFVTYTVQPKKTVENGEIIDSVATIVFDNNAPIDTPEIFNTIDAENPVSELVSTSDVSATETVLEWTAEDNEDGSGYAGAEVYVSVDMTPFVLAMTVMNERKAIFNTEENKKYEFFVRAKDNAGNAEALKSEAEKAVDTGFEMLQVETPVANTILNGVDNEIQLVELTTATEGADIFFTTDGEEPTTESEKYLESIAVMDNTTIKAIAVKDGMIQSEIMEFIYERPTDYEFMYGDIYSDGKINIKDAQYLFMYIIGANRNLTEEELAAADVYRDGVINVKDAQKLAQYLASWPNVELGA